VGAGLGSATEALLDELAARDAVGRIAAYRATEPVPLFSRRAQRILTALHPGVPLAFGSLNVNDPWGAQGVAAGSQDLVWGVNVFHLARDLDAVLREAHAALAGGGWLVVAEGMRPSATDVVGAEFPFRLLESFTDVRLDPTTRPTSGFLTAEHWLAALARTGFGDVAVVPQHLGLMDELSVRENVEYPARLARCLEDRRDLIEDLLERLGLAGMQHRPPTETSLGEQQRTAVARAVVLAPSLLVADEPTAHQDARRVER